MNVSYNRISNILSITLSPEPVAESDEHKPGVILDYDDRGRLVGIEILDASEHVPDLTSIQFRVVV